MYKLKIKMRKYLLKGPTKSLYNILSVLRVKYYSDLSDKEFLIRNMKSNTGLKVDLDNPIMLCEKILWIKYRYRNPLMKTCTDKIEVRKYVSQKGYENLLPEIIGVYNKFDDINFTILPDNIFLKSTHVSGINQIINKNSTNINKVKKIFDKAQKINYYTKSREWNYDGLKPRLIVEPVLDMTKYIDYKFFVINGKVEFFAVIKEINDKNGNQSLKSKFNLYNTDLKPLDVDVKRPKFDDTNFTFTPKIEDLFSISENLASPFPYCRIDFLVSDNEILFGEITFFPTGGNMVMYPLEKEIYYGNKLDLNKIEEEFIVGG
ncbi:ATP-grasp fold amidoligase family protein [Mammaliicoccus sp. H-M33]|uniref:ATP-grasp fold amidoligase family protein n=1 Tax=Mammaliicoccus sp. H-M33 TaxID=2898692 RepID=UPI001EFBD3FE|nr:ATP-grasp fold amidoligase family protein [Mammaliicoccus sp. H-M33]